MGKRSIKKINYRFNKVVIATFSSWRNGKRTPTNGMIEPLISFFGPKTNHLTLIDAQHPGSDTIVPIVEEYNYNILVKKYFPRLIFPPRFILNRFNSLKTQPTFKIRDFITTAEVLLKKNSVDLFIGLESIFTLAGILFRKLGKIKKVIYYVSDFSPNRYNSRIFNTIYLWLDRYCVQHADYIWDVSPAMMPARIKNGLNPQKARPLILVPNALFPWQIIHANHQEPNSLVFAGTIGPENGLDLAIHAFYLAKKRIPDLTLHIFGGGLNKDEKEVAELIKRYDIKNAVFNHGFINNLQVLSNQLSHYMIGLAPYKPLPWSVRWYADATKLRLYFGSGIPAISTFVAPLAHETEKFGCTVMTDDSPNALSNAIIQLLTNKKVYKNMRNKAMQYSNLNTWDKVYKNAIKQMNY